MRPFFEALESRQMMSATIVEAAAGAVIAAPAASVVAPLVTAAPVLGRAYAGTYKIGTAKHALSFELVKAYTGGIYAATVTDAGVKYDGNVVVSSTGISVNWFTYDATMAQVPVGTLQGTLSTDGLKLTGTVTKGTASGAATLTQKAVPVADQNFTWVGTYTINGVSRKIGVQLIKGYGRGMYFINVTDSGKVFDGNMYTGTNGVTYINWFTYDANWNQVPKGGIVVTGVSADGNTIAGTITKGKLTGTVLMTRPGLAPSPV